MRILYDSKNKAYKSKFGTLRENEGCTVNIHIPKHCKTKNVMLLFKKEDGADYSSYSMYKSGEYSEYEIYSCDFSFAKAGLYFYYFVIQTENERFSLYKQGYDQTNMEDGDLWQISVIPNSFNVPTQYAGNIMYQIFPDRFNKDGQCDTTDKIKPFTIHRDTNEIPVYLPDKNGIVQNNDFFGGNLKGITSKLDYLKELYVDVIYLNPIFKAYSNHRYDTADYLKIDELLGNEDDFVNLCKEAHKRDIKIILDGVFSHTGSNSIYFDAEKTFGNGALSDINSPYKQWFNFIDYPDKYESWWGIKTLPCVNENNESYKDYIINNENSVIAQWLKLGADGFRLDVADELPDNFILELRNRMKSIKPDSILIGEVWEDASNKYSYGIRRKYFTDGELDSVMNYPFRKCIIDYCLGNDNGHCLRDTVMTIAENYPKEVLDCLMNVISTHDTVRIINALGVENVPSSKVGRCEYKLSYEEFEKAKSRLFVAVFLQFILPGMPCIYYGDEIGTEGFEDPFCRLFFDWSKTNDNVILDFYKKISSVKSANDVLKRGNVFVDVLCDGVIEVKRQLNGVEINAFINLSDNVYETAYSKTEIISEKCRYSDNKLFVEKFGFILLN